MTSFKEADVLDAAEVLAKAEKALAQEYLLRVASGIQTFQAQKMAEVEKIDAVRRAQAEYEIALNRMRKS